MCRLRDDSRVVYVCQHLQHKSSDTLKNVNKRTGLQRISELATGQWGLLTTAQAKAAGVSRAQLSRYAASGVLERLVRGVYVFAAATDRFTHLKAVWLALVPSQRLEERLGDAALGGVISHASAAHLHRLGDLPADLPEITFATRKQTRLRARLHQRDLTPGEITVVEGLPVTTIERTVVDLLLDGHEEEHVATIIGQALQQGRTSKAAMAAALEALARKHRYASGRLLLERLLDHVEMSDASLVRSLAGSPLGGAISAAALALAAESLGQASDTTIPNESLQNLAVDLLKDTYVAAQPLPVALASLTQKAQNKNTQVARNSSTPQPLTKQLIAKAEGLMLELEAGAQGSPEHGET